MSFVLPAIITLSKFYPNELESKQYLNVYKQNASGILGVFISSNNIAGCLHLSIVSDMVSWHYGMFSDTTSAKSYFL